ncbi:uracil-DNA glycosylase [Arthrobacter sp. I2-34]|uniref:Uracil-DNA glycosylase n=1 Tax=Arthrobacter hankyongi TaxID=2904801 RepID=A0ABS9LAD6_9MICC|nr:uracil-DNA glycosylase [Arthrobacter hankyongi]MCG2623648.1 uracil-DNA glycosylase [Arthrobacter hankyongi]
MGTQSIEAFLAGVAGTKPGPDSDNFLHGSSPGNLGRRRNLELYLQEMLERRPKVLLLGEAPGYRGMTVTGVPFTNPAMLHGRSNHFGLFGSGKGYALPADAPALAAEPTATVMWQVLAELDFLPLLWSAYPLHPHLPGRPLSNRTPTAAEIATGKPIWLALAELFGVESVVAVGNVADRSVRASGRTAPKVRHPAHGGKARFRLGLQELLAAGIDD